MDRQVKVVIVVLILNFSLVPLVSGYYSHYLPRTHDLIVEENATQGVSWSISVSKYLSDTLGENIGTYQTTGHSITVSLPYGYYSYTVKPPNGYITDSAPHEVHLTSHKAVGVQALQFLELFPLSFTQRGLGKNQTWSVALSLSSGNHLKTTSNSTITFSEPAGTYNYSIGTASNGSTKLYPVPLSPVSKEGYSNIILSSPGTVVNVNFTARTYAVTIYVSSTAQISTGNPNGIGIKMDGQQKYSSFTFSNSSYSPVVFHLPDGEYQYSSAHITGFNAINGNGYIHVHNSPTNRTIFYNSNYA